MTFNSDPIYVSQVGWGTRDVVVLHGYGQSGRTFAPFLAPLLRECRFHLVDLPGMGRSRAEFPFSEDLFARNDAALEDTIARLGLSRFHLLGYSVGAQIALRWLSRGPRPQVINYIHVDHTPFAGRSWAGGFDEKLLNTFREFNSQLDFTAPAVGSIFAQPQAIQNGYAECLQALVDSGLSLAGKGFVVPALFGFAPFRNWSLDSVQWSWAREYIRAYATDQNDLRALVRNIDVPVTVIAGGTSALCPPAAVEFMRAELPKGSVHVLKGVGHDLILRAPFKFASAVRAGLSEF